MGEGYGREWTNWDAYVAHFWPKPEDVKYRNWYPFLSPKGKWLAFYGKSYTDINIIDLETKELVVRDFYSRYRGHDVEDVDGKRKYTPRPDHVYNGGHCNVSTYVPHYSYTQFKSTSKTREHLCSCLEDYDFDKFDPEKPDEYMSTKGSAYEHVGDSRTIRSIPVAFNAFTYWAADFEFYVDVIDLSDVDNGVIKLINGGSFVIPRSADHVRNFVDCTFDGEDDPTKPFTVGMRYNIMEERGPFDYGFNEKDNTNKLDIYKDGKWQTQNHKDLLPWQEVQKRDEEYKAKQEAAKAVKGE